MSYTSKNTLWLSDSIGQDVKDLITKFYTLADPKESNAGTRMATEVFTNDAVLVTANGTFRGVSEIARSRDNAWSVVESRKHRVLKVFASDQEDPELSILGAVEMSVKNGRSLDSPFACHVKLVLSYPESVDCRITHMQVFEVPWYTL
ncbi:hypothetical protein BGZ61DRAFT_376428 [Ilyonectria robusta]|uniref:uncharacterized protein n=1 Tax=Ilyonectria robusta TaxID=1079257 RepID=UPI001E8D0913|nr:uncharacterized protein BGZ61DRAFT_376428 [Ilyonectria robusta]KAH8648259.1 hypothetical protein BGZ61DRAFT_376428 [Ilyonectria robusta]